MKVLLTCCVSSVGNRRIDVRVIMLYIALFISYNLAFYSGTAHNTRKRVLQYEKIDTVDKSDCDNVQCRYRCRCRKLYAYH